MELFWLIYLLAMACGDLPSQNTLDRDGASLLDGSLPGQVVLKRTADPSLVLGHATARHSPPGGGPRYVRTGGRCAPVSPCGWGSLTTDRFSVPIPSMEAEICSPGCRKR